MRIVLGFVRAQWQPLVQGPITSAQDTQAQKEVLEENKLAVIAPENCPL